MKNGRFSFRSDRSRLCKFTTDISFSCPPSTYYIVYNMYIQDIIFFFIQNSRIAPVKSRISPMWNGREIGGILLLKKKCIPSGTSGVCQLENSILPLQSDMKRIFRLSIYLFRGDDPQYELYIRKYLFVYTKHDPFINTREIYLEQSGKTFDRFFFRCLNVCNLLSANFSMKFASLTFVRSKREKYFRNIIPMTHLGFTCAHTTFPIFERHS